MSYTKHYFTTGETIQAAPFNDMETQIAANETAIAGKASASDLFTLQNAVAGKASASDLSALQNTVAGKAAAADVTLLDERVTALEGSSISPDLKAALLLLAQKAAYTDGNGAAYYAALSNALNASSVSVSSISASLNLNGHTVYTTDALDDLKQYLTVTASYSNSTSHAVVGYTLSGTLTAGTSTITVTYSGKTTTFNVTVTAPSATLSSISAVFNSGNTTIHASDTLDSLKQYLTVTATYSDSSTAAVAGANYTLSGTLTVGTSTVTVTYSGKTTTFNVTVAADPVTLSSISAAFNSGATTIYETDSLDSLKQYLTVTATYSDSSTAAITGTNYTLSGTLSEGTSTITVSYGGKTTTFNVTVADAASVTLSSISASLNLNGHTVYENDTLDDLRPYLTVTAAYSDSSTATITSADYTLSGTLAAGTRTITVGYGGQTATFTVTVTAVLPSGYTRLAYVAASGAQYLDIGVTEGDAYNAKYEVMVTDVAYNKGNHILSGKYTFFPFLRRNSSGTPELGIKNRSTESISSGSQSFAWALNERHVLEGYKDNKVKVDGQEMLTITPGTVDGTNNIYLFNYTYYAGNDYKFRGRLYWAKVYGANDTLLRDFIPCKNSQDVAGLYDLVTNTFYTSDTSTALIAGEVA